MRPCGMLSRRFGSGFVSFCIGVAARGLEAAGGLLLLPLIVTRFSPAEVGVWYIFLTLQGLIVLLDFGFQPTIARAFASAFGGARMLMREGLHTDRQTTPNYALAGEIIHVARRLYGFLALAVIGVMATVGLGFLWFLIQRDGLSIASVLPAWLAFAVAIGMTVYLMWVSPLLVGSGKMTANYGFLLAGKLTFIATASALLLGGMGLLALPIATFAAALAGRLVAQPFLAEIVRPALQACPASRDPELLSVLWHNASRMGLVSAGGFIITRANIFVVSVFTGLAASAAYAISLQLLTALMAVALLPSQIAMPRIVAARLASNKALLKQIFLLTTVVAASIFAAGLLFVLISGPPLLARVGSTVELLPTMLLTLLGVVLLLETNHVNSALMIATANVIPFVRSAVISGLAVVVLATLAASLGFGLQGVILAQGVAQLAYNNWRWPLAAIRQLNA